ncbi:MAG: hypothetical protein WAN65_06420 [Candidatus Sulfotelmatobacter sp.]
MTDETNESAHKVPETDSAKQAEKSSSEHVKTEGVTSSATDDICVACNVTQQIELVPDFEPGPPKESDATKIDEQELDRRISEMAGEIQRHHHESGSHAEAESACWRDLMPLIDEKQKLLTRRGKKSEKNLTAFLSRNGLNPSTVRSWRRRLKKEQAAPPEPESVDIAEGSSDATGAGECPERGVREEIKSGSELLTEYAKKMLEVLLGKSIKSESMRIKRAAEMLKDLQRTIDEGKLFANVPSVEPQAVPQAPQPPTLLSSALKPGDCSGLFSSISNLCGGHFKAAFKELEPEVMTDVFGKFVERLAKMYCRRPSGEALELKVTVEEVTRKLPQSPAQRYREFGSFV